MPELPELEHVRRQLENKLTGQRILDIRVDAKGGPIVVRDLTGDGLESRLLGAQVADVRRRGKFLLFDLGESGWLAINPKLTGRLAWTDPTDRWPATARVGLTFDGSEQQLRYLDDKRMGQIYLTDALQDIPTFAQMGPNANDIDLRQFKQRLRRFRGEIKGVLTREQFIAGIGNAYADEILWQARLHPYRKRPSLSSDEVDELYRAMRVTLLEAGHLARQVIGDSIERKPRQILQVHLRGGEPCPRCGTNISEIRARRRLTNFCRNCQPGGLIRGMGSPTLD